MTSLKSYKTVSYHGLITLLENSEVTHIKLKKPLKAFLNLMKNYPYGLLKF